MAQTKTGPHNKLEKFRKKGGSSHFFQEELLYVMHLGERNPNGGSLELARMLTDQRFGRLFLALKLHESLRLATRLKQLGLDDGAMLT